VVTRKAAPPERQSWLLLLYKIPPEPTSGRVYAWRKLKALGAILLHDAAWVLPANARTREALRWLAVEIEERGGEALVWEARQMPPADDEALIQQFRAQAEAGYAEVLHALAQAGADLTAVSRRYQQARSQDYFNSPLGQEARAALLAAQEDRQS
jgi:hypothetical protein